MLTGAWTRHDLVCGRSSDIHMGSPFCASVWSPRCCRLLCGICSRPMVCGPDGFGFNCIHAAFFLDFVANFFLFLLVLRDILLPCAIFQCTTAIHLSIFIYVIIWWVLWRRVGRHSFSLCDEID